jgi:hypothetical protein
MNVDTPNLPISHYNLFELSGQPFPPAMFHALPTGAVNFVARIRPANDSMGTIPGFSKFEPQSYRQKSDYS